MFYVMLFWYLFVTNVHAQQIPPKDDVVISDPTCSDDLGVQTSNKAKVYLIELGSEKTKDKKCINDIQKPDLGQNQKGYLILVLDEDNRWLNCIPLLLGKNPILPHEGDDVTGYTFGGKVEFGLKTSKGLIVQGGFKSGLYTKLAQHKDMGDYLVTGEGVILVYTDQYKNNKTGEIVDKSKLPQNYYNDEWDRLCINPATGETVEIGEVDVYFTEINRYELGIDNSAKNKPLSWSLKGNLISFNYTKDNPLPYATGAQNLWHNTFNQQMRGHLASLTRENFLTYGINLALAYRHIFDISQKCFVQCSAGGEANYSPLKSEKLAGSFLATDISYSLNKKTKIILNLTGSYSTTPYDKNLNASWGLKLDKENFIYSFAVKNLCDYKSNNPETYNDSDRVFTVTAGWIIGRKK